MWYTTSCMVWILFCYSQEKLHVCLDIWKASVKIPFRSDRNEVRQLPEARKTNLLCLGELTWTWHLSRKLQWIFWLKTCRCLEKNRTSGHLDDATRPAWRHVFLLFFLCFVLFYFHWVEFYPSRKLKKGYVDYKVSPGPPSTQWWLINGNIFHFRWTISLRQKT